MSIMRNMLLLIVVLMAASANVKAEEPTGKPLKACEHKNNSTYTHHVRHETDCHKFYKCLGRYGFVMECPTLKGVQLVFNEELQVCDWEGVPCLDEPSTPTGSSSTETSTDSSSTETPTDSSSTETPTDSSSTETPTDSSSTETPTDSSSTETPTDSSSTPSATRVPPPSCEGNPSRKQPHEDCHKFWYCDYGKLLEGTCLEGMNFNPIIAECDYYDC